MNTNLLKDAIADADAIKKMAIENAKASLNEAFDSKVKAMLAARLAEEADDLEEKYEEDEDEAAKLDEKKHEEEGDDEGYGMEEAEKESEEDEHEAYGHKEEEEADEAFDLDAILAELEKGEEEKGKEVMEKKEVEDEEDEEKEEEEEESVDEEIDINALLAEMKDEEDDKEKADEAAEPEEEGSADLKEGGATELAQVLLGMAGLASSPVVLDKLISALPEKAQDILMRIAKQAAKSKGLGEETEDVQEIKRQAEELAQKVNETNLINAKLLYLNKILRKYTLSEQQKIKVISAFDKAETAKEAKIVHESLDHAFSVKNDNVKTGLKESIGFASSAAGTSTKRVITESVISDVDKQVNRWQKLAGIIK